MLSILGNATLKMNMRLLYKILIASFILLNFLVISPKNVIATVSWGKEPHLNDDKNRILFHIKKDNGDEFIVVLYVDGRAVDNLHGVRGTSNYRTSDNQGGALSLPSAFTDQIATVKVCSGGGGIHNADKWNCESGNRTLLLESTVEIGQAGGAGQAGQEGKNPCTNTGCVTALGNIPTNPQDFASKVLAIAIGLAGGIALIFMVMGAIKVLTSAGDPKKVTDGRDMIVAAVSGLLFLILSVLILRFIGSNLLGGVPGF